MHYKMIHMLKKGSDKKIYLIQEYKTNIFFILKESSRKDNLNNEYNMLYQLKEILQLKYLEYIEGESLCYLIYDYKEGCNLEEFINAHKEVHLSLREDYFEQIIIKILEQIIKLHTYKYVIVHRDIKPRNIIIDSNYDIWIIDFSAAIILNDISINSLKIREYGTIGYSAPEQFANTRQDIRADIYGIGQTMKYLFPNILFKSKKSRKKWMYIMNKCTQQNMEERYNNVEQILFDINQLHCRNRITIYRIVCK